MTEPVTGEWPEDADRVWGTCDQCGRETWVVQMADPADVDVIPDEDQEEDEYWCAPCAERRASEA